MKTVLPTAINNEDQARELLTELYNNRESFHPEDDANDLVDDPFTKDEGDLLNKLMNDIYSLGVDPCLIYCQIIEVDYH